MYNSGCWSLSCCIVCRTRSRAGQELGWCHNTSNQLCEKLPEDNAAAGANNTTLAAPATVAAAVRAANDEAAAASVPATTVQGQQQIAENATEICVCHDTPAWYEQNHRLITELVWRLGHSPHNIEEFLKKLLFSNFAQLLRVRAWHEQYTTQVPYGNPFRAQPEDYDIYDWWGNLKQPLAPANTFKVLKLMKYLINTAIAWVRRYAAHMNVYEILGPHHALVTLLQAINCSMEYPFDLNWLLDAIHKLDLRNMTPIPSRNAIAVCPQPKQPLKIESTSTLYHLPSSNLASASRLSQKSTETFSVKPRLKPVSSIVTVSSTLLNGSRSQKSIRNALPRIFPGVTRVLSTPLSFIRHYPSHTKQQHIATIANNGMLRTPRNICYPRTTTTTTTTTTTAHCPYALGAKCSTTSYIVRSAALSLPTAHSLSHSMAMHAIGSSDI